MEINKTTIYMYYICRFFGLAPYSVKENQLMKTQINFSLRLTIYSIVLISLCLILTNYGIYSDITSDHPIRWELKENCYFPFSIIQLFSLNPYFVRMTTPTNTIITFVDVNIVVGSCFIGVFTSVFGLKNVQLLNERLRRVDRVESIMPRHS